MATVYEFVTPPVKAATWDFYISLVSQGDTDIFQKTVTLAAGDVIIYQDGVLDGNADTLPAEIGATGILKVALSANEMDCDSLVIAFSDAAGDEWQDAIVEIKTVQAVTVSDGTGVTLANDAITSAKYDESSAYPVKSADTGSTKIARTGADSDTLETLSDEIAAVPTAAENTTAVLTTAMTEAYASDGSNATLAQALYEIMQFHNERTAGETTITIKKRDGSTTAFTLTYDSDSITRAT